MPKNLILKYRKNFSYLFDNGLRYSSKYFSIIYVDANDLKFAFIAPRKYIKKAVNRNYTKRVMKEFTRVFISKYSLSNLYIAIKSKYDLKELKKQIGFLLIKEDFFTCMFHIYEYNKNNSQDLSK